MRAVESLKQNVLWIAAAAVVVIIFASMYGMVQQAQRTDANSPQIQIAEDVAAQLDAGVSPDTTVSTMPAVNIGRSLAPYVVIYDKAGLPVAGSGKLDGKLPTAPKGILTAAENVGYHAVTMQPSSALRLAVVTTASDKYYVLSGRSLREVEKNETQSLYVGSIGEIGSLFIILILYLTIGRKRNRKAAASK